MSYNNPPKFASRMTQLARIEFKINTIESHLELLISGHRLLALDQALKMQTADEKKED